MELLTVWFQSLNTPHMQVFLMVLYLMYVTKLFFLVLLLIFLLGWELVITYIESWRKLKNETYYIKLNTFYPNLGIIRFKMEKCCFEEFIIFAGVFLKLLIVFFLSLFIFLTYFIVYYLLQLLPDTIFMYCNCVIRVHIPWLWTSCLTSSNKT